MAASEAVQESLVMDHSQPSKPRVLLAASGSVAAIKFENLCRSFSEWADVRAVATTSSLPPGEPGQVRLRRLAMAGRGLGWLAAMYSLICNINYQR